TLVLLVAVCERPLPSEPPSHPTPLDYVFPDLTEKAGPTDNTGQSQETPSLPSPLPGVDLVGPPWHVAPGEEEEEQLLPVTRPQEDTRRQAPGFPPTGRSWAPRPAEHRPEESGDQAASGGEAGSSMEPGLSPPRVSLSPVTLKGQDAAVRGAGPTVLPAAGRGGESEAPREPDVEAATAAAGLDGWPGAGPSPASFPQMAAPRGAEDPSRDALQPGASASLPLAPGGTELTPSSVTLGQDDLRQEPQEGSAGVAPSRRPWDSTQVICKDWSNLAGKSYVVLNMTENLDCEAFRRHRGLQLLALVEGVLPRHGRGRHGAWHISLSKPSEKEQHLLMALVGEQGSVLPGAVSREEALPGLLHWERCLRHWSTRKIGIQSYSTTSSCQARASAARSDYGTLFVVLVVIGALCLVIIALGLLYNCWQRRLPKLKHVSHGEELRFVENGCHDNPTLDVASDSQSEMQEKQSSLNGGGAVNGPGGWSALMGGKRDPEDSDVFEEDTHL
ncbi:hypothetical protein FD755_010595, partial [Muntiacus reevesi]